MCPRFTLLTELNLNQRLLSEAYTFDFIEATFGHTLGPGAFRGIAPRRGREEIREPFFPLCRGAPTLSQPQARATPGATQLVVKFPLSRSSFRHYVASYAADPSA